MIVLQAPHYLIQTTTILPNPDYEDAEGLASALITKTARDGTLYTYVRSNQRRILSYEWFLTREKALELEAFLKAYYGEEMRLTNHKDEVWRVKIIDDILEFNTPMRQERQMIALQFEGVRLV
jgi:hypothetical protein